VEIPYTICFCCYQQQVLMLYRTFPPNAQLWNGLGGKIEADETPLASVRREMQEEADIDLREASSLFFAGITTWGLIDHDPVKGMYVFIVHLSPQQAEQVHSLNTPEGFIAWKSLAWVCDPNNQTVVSNIPRFLPPMLEAQTPYEYFYAYENETSPSETFRQLVIRPLPSYIVLSECQEW
jgi:8-oxo-dGTP diphosphatase